MAEIESKDLDFDPSALQRGRKHSGADRRVVAECLRCSFRYEIGEGGNTECPTCGQSDAARVVLREMSRDRWQKVDPECAVSSCLGVPTHEVVVVERIPGTPEVPILLCDAHKDTFITRPWKGPNSD